MMAYPEFYKKHMSLCIGFAPVTTMSHHTIEVFKYFAENKTVMKLIKSQCPSILSKSVTSQPLISKLYSMSKVNSKAHGLPLSMIIEEHPEYCTKEAIDNYTGHFPAGGSYK